MMLLVNNQSGPRQHLYLIAVTGKSNIEEANIGGITPAVLIFKR